MKYSFVVWGIIVIDKVCQKANKKRMLHCDGAPDCKCHFTRQELLAEKDKRITEEGELTSYPQKPKYIVHYTNKWYCSDCGHPISQHMSEPSSQQSTEHEYDPVGSWTTRAFVDSKTTPRRVQSLATVLSYGQL